MYKNATLRTLVRMYGWVISFGSNLQSLFLLWMRLTWGHQFVLIGAGKLHDISQATQLFASNQIPHPEFHAYLVGYTELIGGAMLIFGLASRLISIPLMMIMITALSTVHAGALADFQFVTNPSALVHVTPYPFLITTLLILCFGPGRISTDAIISHWVNRQPKH